MAKLYSFPLKFLEPCPDKLKGAKGLNRSVEQSLLTLNDSVTAAHSRTVVATFTQSTLWGPAIV